MTMETKMTTAFAFAIAASLATPVMAGQCINPYAEARMRVTGLENEQYHARYVALKADLKQRLPRFLAPEDMAGMSSGEEIAEIKRQGAIMAANGTAVDALFAEWGVVDKEYREATRMCNIRPNVPTVITLPFDKNLNQCANSETDQIVTAALIHGSRICNLEIRATNAISATVDLTTASGCPAKSTHKAAARFARAGIEMFDGNVRKYGKQVACNNLNTVIDFIEKSNVK